MHYALHILGPVHCISSVAGSTPAQRVGIQCRQTERLNSKYYQMYLPFKYKTSRHPNLHGFSWILSGTFR